MFCTAVGGSFGETTIKTVLRGLSSRGESFNLSTKVLFCIK